MVGINDVQLWIYLISIARCLEIGWKGNEPEWRISIIWERAGSGLKRYMTLDHLLYIASVHILLICSNEVEINLTICLGWEEVTLVIITQI